MKIAVGLSGGVDSSVAAYLLKQAGHDVIGTIMKIRDGGCAPVASKGNACYGPGEEDNIADARKVCEFLDIPLHVVNCSRQYRDIVLNNFKSEYYTGRTPNPCVLCNQTIKFGVLPTLLAESGIAFDRFATGHYAQVTYDTASSRYLLKKAVDVKKDQTYFLYRLTQKQLARILFPLGKHTKSEVRNIALDTGLPVHDKGESQDFYSGDYTDLLEVEHIAGDIVNRDGKILGTHNGIWHYTVGQRKGLGISHTEPLYVLAINAEKNEIVVGEKKFCYSGGLQATDLTIITGELPARGTAKIRSNSKEVAGSFSLSGNALRVIFDKPQSSVTPGQSVVIYHNDIVIGGGIIAKAIS